MDLPLCATTADLEFLEDNWDDQNPETGFLTHNSIELSEDEVLAADNIGWSVRIDQNQIKNPGYEARFRLFAQGYLNLWGDDDSASTDLIEKLYTHDTEETRACPELPQSVKKKQVSKSETKIQVETINTYKFYTGDVLQDFFNPIGVSLSEDEAIALENSCCHDYPNPWLREDLLVAHLVDSNSQVISLQEVLSNDIFVDVIKKTNDQRVAQGKIPYQTVFFTDQMASGKTAMALLSVYPIQNAEFHEMAWQGSHEERCWLGVLNDYRNGFGTAQVDINGTLTTVVLVHNLPQEDLTREQPPQDDVLTPEREMYWQEMRAALSKLDLPASPSIILGDFNANPEQKGYQSFTQIFPNWTDALSVAIQNQVYDGKVSSFRADSPHVVEQGQPDLGIIDHIQVNGWSTDYAYVDPSTEHFSDHDGLVAGLSLLASDGEKTFADQTQVNPAALRSLKHYFSDGVKISPYCDLVASDSTLARQQQQALTLLNLWQPDQLTPRRESRSLLVYYPSNVKWPYAPKFYPGVFPVSALSPSLVVTPFRGAPNFSDLSESLSLHSKQGLSAEW